MQAVPIAGVAANVSVLTFNRASGTLFAVVNRPPTVIVLDTNGRILRSVRLHGLSDTEGITHVDDDWFVVAEEGKKRLTWVHILQSGQGRLVEKGASLELGGRLFGNLGFEGVSWDEAHSELWVVNEKWPKQALSVTGFERTDRTKNQQVKVRQWDKAVWLSPLGSDLASISVHSETGNLLLLSDESAVLVEMSPDGMVVSTLPLWRGWHGLTRSVHRRRA